MQWDIDNDRPIYTQLIELVEGAVASGEFAPGQRLPGVRELAAQAGVNPNTMQRALAELETRGLLYTQRTSGRFVTEDAARIAEVRAQLAGRLTRQYLEGMAALGYSRRETEKYVSQVEVENDADGS